MKTRSYNVITEALSDIHGTKINKNDLYKKNNYLFVNIKKHNTIEVFDYPVNEYFEPLNHLFNWYNKDFHDLVDNDVDNNSSIERTSSDKILLVNFFSFTFLFGIILTPLNQ